MRGNRPLLQIGILAFVILPLGNAETGFTIKDLAQDIRQAKLQISEQEQNQRKILGSLYQINKKMRKMSEKRTELSDQKMALNGDIQDLAKQTARLEKRLEGQRRILAKQLGALYRMKGQGALRVIFSTQNAHDFDRNLKFLKLLSTQSRRAISDYQRSVSELKEKRTQLERQVRQLLIVEKRLEGQEQKLGGQQESKMALLERLKTSRERYLKRIKSLKMRTKVIANEEMDREVARWLRDSFFEKRGSLLPPLDGSVARSYGYIEDPKYKFRLTHEGLFIQGEKGQPVVAIHGGVVSFAGSLTGYGKTIIVDHGDHYYSVYGHVASLDVEFGDEVESGQKIAHVGWNTTERKQGLYFEIRHFSDAIDPIAWFKWSNRGEKKQL